MIVLRIVLALWGIFNAALATSFIDFVLPELKEKGLKAVLLFPQINDHIRETISNKTVVVLFDIWFAILFLPALIMYTVLIALILSIIAIWDGFGKLFKFR